jgi:hypothetical protein
MEASVALSSALVACSIGGGGVRGCSRGVSGGAAWGGGGGVRVDGVE